MGRHWRISGRGMQISRLERSCSLQCKKWIAGGQRRDQKKEKNPIKRLRQKSRLIKNLDDTLGWAQVSDSSWKTGQEMLKGWNQDYPTRKTEWNHSICSSMDGPKIYHSKWSKLDKYHNVRFPGGSEVKVSTSNMGDLGLIPRLGRSPGGEFGSPLHIFAWRIPWTEEPGGLQTIGLQRVGHDWAT